MKKIAKLMTLALTVLILASCEDVPSPFGTVAPPKNDATNDNPSELPYTSTNLNTGWTLVNVTNEQPWSKGSSYVQATGYQAWEGDTKSNKAVEGWVVSPAISTRGYENIKLYFDHTIRYTNNVSDWEANHKVFASANFDESNPSEATWVELTDFKPKASPYNDWTLYSSGELQLPKDMVGKEAVNIGFWFKAPASASTTWELKNFTIEEGIAENSGNDNTDDNGEGEGTEDNPFDVAAAIAKGQKSGVYVKAYIVGSVEGQVYESGAKFSAEASTQTNILIANNADETEATKCMPIQLPTGEIRTKLNLKDNPGNYKKEILLYGDITTYFSVPGLKNTSYAVIDGASIGTKPGEESLTPSGEIYTLAKTVSDGSYAIAAADGNNYVVAQALTSGYGYLKFSEATLNGNALSPVAANNVFTFKSTTGGFTIQDSEGQYIYMTGTYNSFNRSTDKPDEGAVWTISIADDGKASIKNTSTNKTIQYSSQYSSFGAYSDITNTLPCLFTNGGTEGENTGNAILDINFKTDKQGSWSVSDIKALPEGLSYVWTYDEKYGMKASAYANNTRFETDSWLVSPTISVPNGGTMTFKQALNYASSEFVKVMYTTTNGSGDINSQEWKEASVDNWPAGNNWTFIESKATLPSGVVRVAFRYTSNTTTAATWEIEFANIK